MRYTRQQVLDRLHAQLAAGKPHGGPIATPEDARYVQERTDAVGFIGASSMERLPVETAITNTVRAFKDLPIRKTKSR